MREPRAALVLGTLLALVTLVAPANAAVKPRVVLIAPFEASTLPADDRWIGEGIGQVITLGLSQHPAVRAAAHEAIERWGTGAGSARLIAGSRPVHSELERELADW